MYATSPRRRPPSIERKDVHGESARQRGVADCSTMNLFKSQAWLALQSGSAALSESRTLPHPSDRISGLPLSACARAALNRTGSQFIPRRPNRSKESFTCEWALLAGAPALNAFYCRGRVLVPFRQPQP